MVSIKLDPAVTRHLQSVYACLARSFLTAAAGSYVHVVTGVLQGGLLMSILALVLLVLLATTRNQKRSTYNTKNHALRLGYLTGFSFLSGLNLGPILDNAIVINPAIISTALLATAIIFISFTFSITMLDYYDNLYFKGMLFSGCSIVSILGLRILFIGFRVYNEAILYLGLFVMCSLIPGATQLIIDRHHVGDDDYIWHSINMCIDIITILCHLVISLATTFSNMLILLATNFLKLLNLLATIFLKLLNLLATIFTNMLILLATNFLKLLIFLATNFLKFLNWLATIFGNMLIWLATNFPKLLILLLNLLFDKETKSRN